MKNKIAIVGLLSVLAAGLITINTHKATADNPRVEAATVVLAYEVTYEWVANGIIARNPDGTFKEIGLHVTRISSSGNAPAVSYGEELAIVSARLQNAGLLLVQPPTPRGELIFNRAPR